MWIGSSKHNSHQKFHLEGSYHHLQSSAAAKAGLRTREPTQAPEVRPSGEQRALGFVCRGPARTSPHLTLPNPSPPSLPHPRYFSLPTAPQSFSSPSHTAKSSSPSSTPPSFSPLPPTSLNSLLPSLSLPRVLFSKPPREVTQILSRLPHSFNSHFSLKIAPFKIPNSRATGGSRLPTLTRRRDHPQSCCSASRTSWLCHGRRRTRTDWKTM